MVRPKKPLFAGPFSIYSGCSSAAQSRFCSKCSTWNIVFAELRACEMFHVEHFGVCSPLPRGGFCLGRAFSPGGAGVLGEAFESKLPFPFTGRRGGAGSFALGGRVTVRRRTRRFGHAAPPPCSVFAPMRTTRRQRRGWLGFQLTVSQTNGSVHHPTSLPPSLPRQNGVGFSQLFWPGSHQGTGRVNPAVFPALPFLIAPVSLSFSSSRCYTGVKSTAKGGLLKYVSALFGVCLCSAFWQACSLIG